MRKGRYEGLPARPLDLLLEREPRAGVAVARCCRRCARRRVGRAGAAGVSAVSGGPGLMFLLVIACFSGAMCLCYIANSLAHIADSIDLLRAFNKIESENASAIAEPKETT